jgi:hypothetical protein
MTVPKTTHSRSARQVGLLHSIPKSGELSSRQTGVGANLLLT